MGNANGEVDAQTSARYALATHQRPIVHLFVSRETCRRLQPHSIPARTDVGLMTGEGIRCQPGECTYPCTNRVGVTPIGSHMGALLPGTGVLQASKYRHRRAASDGTCSCPFQPRLCPRALPAVPSPSDALLAVGDCCRPLSLLALIAGSRTKDDSLPEQLGKGFEGPAASCTCS